MNQYTKKTLTGIILGIFSLFNISSVFADDNTDASDPISVIANKPATTSSNSSNNDTDNNENISNGNSKNTQPATTTKQSQDAISNMLLQSVSLMGIAYKWGGNTPDTGMDCSGFVRYVFKKSLGINLPRTAAEMAKVGKRVNINELQPGDLIFFKTMGGSRISHIGMYLGNNKFIQSPRTGENIQITDLSGYWVKHYVGAKRVVQENSDDSGNSTLENYQDIRDEALPSGGSSKKSARSYRRGRSRHGTHSTSRKTTKVKSANKSNHTSKSTKKKKKH
ncbi:MAG: C40 family peptidase [Burkholderiales bacterium]|jgi:cell wall-associated NlpC family hydrolase|nr:C40 family peptidase [Burkholderiales bacterium]